MGSISYLPLSPSSSQQLCPSTDLPHPAAHSPACLSGFRPVPYGPFGSSPDVAGHQGSPTPVRVKAGGEGGEGAPLPCLVAGRGPSQLLSLCTASPAVSNNH